MIRPPVLVLGAALAGAAAVPFAVGRLDDATGLFLLGVVALAAALLLAWGAWLRRRGRSDVLRRLRDGCLIVLAMATVWIWLVESGLDFGRFRHPSDSFHYYMGGKYFRELGYDRLYECTVIADAEAGVVMEYTWLRDLATDEIELTAEVLADPDACKRHFRPERWASFTRDVAWFRERTDASSWVSLRLDHGYNPPPTWGVLGSLLTNAAPASGTQLALLTLIDPLLVAVMCGCIVRAFGWRVMCVALIFLGTSYAAGWEWAAGCILRYDWLCAAVCGICLLRLGRPAGGGALIGVSAALRVFPALLLFAMALGWIEEMIRTRRLLPRESVRRVIVGAAGAGLLLAGLGTIVAGGVHSWPEFVRNSRLHLAQPLTNKAGLATVLGYRHDRRQALLEDPGRIDRFARWREARRATSAARAPLFWLLAAGFVALMAGAVRRRPDWVAAVVGAASVPVLFELTSYYWAILLVLAFLWPSREMAGVGLLLLAAASRFGTGLDLTLEETFLWTSLATLALVVPLTASLARRRAAVGAEAGPAT